MTAVLLLLAEPWASSIPVGVQILFTYTPPLQHMCHTMLLDFATWLLILVLVMVKLLAVEAEKWLLRRLGIHRM